MSDYFVYQALFIQFWEWFKCRIKPQFVSFVEEWTALLLFVWPLQRSDSLNTPHSCTWMRQIMETVYTPCAQKCFRRQSWGENKQTNVQFSTGEPAPSRLHLYLQPVKAVGLLPLTRTLPRPCCWNKAPTVCAFSGGVSLGERWAASAVATIEAVWASWG